MRAPLRRLRSYLSPIYVSALEYAANDFDGDASESKVKLIYVFVGNARESCSGIEALEIPKSAADVKLDFFGLGVSKVAFGQVVRRLEGLA